MKQSPVSIIFSSETGIILVSVLLGLGLSSLFRKVCEDGNCVIIKSPERKDIEEKIFKQDNKCYKYKASSTSCSAK